mmetsp:Transcript_20336/g.33536  ORF Transcript_20336/g.33536 Transcript_20336/m.33536 type:complete len:494 (-) Transcript_20336:674-2155(-)|eukprot:CAMPEP_0203749870 /NCGR_PEP_ID=MMETSP0098-20131031/4254_1 /ASSEMBLY_ACC=CAM_ASM_000208 /TAXON_ID=96639 /ORGANISM=" , Strain NY0313808BC1" /LENGTH=493 /DNA_ID=CAMNT_0050638987 /DNA_START=930 /DNA_END=2411 /DNA_ORIENTATION=-
MEQADVVIVGGGLSGLSCAQFLATKSPETSVVVLEANDYLGGRVRPVRNDKLFPGKELELGAEFIHGDSTILHQYAKEEGWKLKQIFIWAHGDGGPCEKEAPDGGAGYYYVGFENKLYRFDQLDEELEKLSDELDKLGTAKNVPKMNMKQYLYSRGVSRKGLAMAEAGYANTLGSSLKALSAPLTCRLESLWSMDGGDIDFRFSPSSRVLLERLCRGLKDTRTGAAVTSIRKESHDRTIVEYRDVKSGERFGISARHVVVTIPIPILRLSIGVPVDSSEGIVFSPPLAADKVRSLQQVGVRGAMKIVARVNKRFWPEDMHGMICSDCHIPELWIAWRGNFEDADGNSLDKENEDARNAESDYYLVVGFAMASFHSDLSVYSEDHILGLFLDQLDQIFGTKESPRPAHDSFEDGFVHDWSKMPFVRGGYSFPAVTETESTRATLARSEHEGTLIFAGEATDNEQAYMTMHAAIRTGERAAKDVIFKQSENKPKL